MLLLPNGLLKLLAFIVRASYFATCVFALAGALYFTIFWTAGDLAITAMLVIVFMLPAGRALLRLSRGGRLIPQPLLRERWEVAAFVAITSLLGNLLAVIVTHAIIEIIAAGKEADGAAGFILFIMILYAIALLCGEVVLVGKNRVDGSPDRLEATRDRQ